MISVRASCSLPPSKPSSSAYQWCAVASLGSSCKAFLYSTSPPAKSNSAVGLISQGYFQGNEVLFTDARECLTASGECARQLIVAYNWFAAHEGKEPIDIDGNDVRVPGHVEQLLNSWVRLSRARALSGMGKIFEARHEVLSLLRSPK